MIQLLDDKTIDKIAAGEVVEKPASVVKELVENSIDAKAKCITVEIKRGGIDFIRVTDDGMGIPAEEVPLAFQRHATSKIVSDEDLHYVMTLGFRGEALASIAAVSMVEMITTRKDSLTGTRIFIEGGIIKETEEVGAPQGTTVKVSHLFYNTPARRKFLKSAQTEGAYIVETMQHMALSRPDLSFKMIVNGQIKFHTSGSNDLKEVIYKIFGRDTAAALIPIEVRENGTNIEGYLGKPELNRGNRNYENYFVNRRFVKSNPISFGIEEGYKNFMMVHRFPFCVLHIDVDTRTVDVNVHPAKMQVRLSNSEEMTELLTSSIQDALRKEELIPKVSMVKEKEEPLPKSAPEPFEKNRIEASVKTLKSLAEERYVENKINERFTSNVFFDADGKEEVHSVNFAEYSSVKEEGNSVKEAQTVPVKEAQPLSEITVEKAEQSRLWDDALLKESSLPDIEILGQVFDTYWLFTMGNSLYFLDQHAAHEKVKYEEFMEKFRNKEILSQNLMPPVVISLQPSEYEIYQANEEVFRKLCFETDSFGGTELVIRAVPLDFYGCRIKDLFEAVLQELMKVNKADSISLIEEKIATMACKAAVKGNMTLTKEEAEELLKKLMTLDQPYHCPHGRPTIIEMSKYELEKKFKRIV